MSKVIFLTDWNFSSKANNPKPLSLHYNLLWHLIQKTLCTLQVSKFYWNISRLHKWDVYCSSATAVRQVYKKYSYYENINLFIFWLKWGTILLLVNNFCHNFFSFFFFKRKKEVFIVHEINPVLCTAVQKYLKHLNNKIYLVYCFGISIGSNRNKIYLNRNGNYYKNKVHMLQCKP